MKAKKPLCIKHGLRHGQKYASCYVGEKRKPKRSVSNCGVRRVKAKRRKA